MVHRQGPHIRDHQHFATAAIADTHPYPPVLHGDVPFAEIWTALKAACEAPDFDTCKLILEAAEVIVAAKDMTVCYDERGFRYDLPQYVLSDPTDLVQDS
jgi:hypothetical protein